VGVVSGSSNGKIKGFMQEGKLKADFVPGLPRPEKPEEAAAHGGGEGTGDSSNSKIIIGDITIRVEIENSDSDSSEFR
jgi:hypothetical protein